MKTEGTEGLSIEDIRHEVSRGGRFVWFYYVFSLVVITFQRASPVVFVRGGRSRAAAGWKYTLLSAVVGWWGIPWGIIYTFQALGVNLGGGTDVTAEIMAVLDPPVGRAGPPPLPPAASA